MDANFRLTNRIRGNEHDDPELGPGWGCMVESVPYKEHLKNYVSEADVSLSPSVVVGFELTMQPDYNMYRLHGSVAEGFKSDHWAAHIRRWRMHVCASRNLQAMRRR